MRPRWLPLVLLLAMLASLAPNGSAAAQVAAPVPGPCAEIDRPDVAPGYDARWKICVPAAGWNGDLVVWAHGYVPPGDPSTFQDELPGDPPVSLPLLVQSLGYAFATTTYPSAGLAVLDAKPDLLALADYFNASFPGERTVYLAGASMGGLIALQLAEQSAGVFDGVMAACGISDLQRVITYWGDFGVLFDYFYPGVLASLPPLGRTPTSANWETIYAPLIARAILAQDPTLDKARQLLTVGKVPPASLTAEGILESILTVLAYSVLPADDTTNRLGGNPFDNTTRVYRGSADDRQLNAGVRRVAADPAALVALQQYATTGRTRVPLVMPHTVLDPVVPFDQTLRYKLKAQPVERGSVTIIPISRYGHCAFTPEEVIVSFAILVFRTTGALPTALDARVANAQGAARELARGHGLRQ